MHIDLAVESLSFAKHSPVLFSYSDIEPVRAQFTTITSQGRREYPPFNVAQCTDQCGGHAVTGMRMLVAARSRIATLHLNLQLSHLCFVN